MGVLDNFFVYDIMKLTNDDKPQFPFYLTANKTSHYV